LLLNIVNVVEPMHRGLNIKGLHEVLVTVEQAGKLRAQLLQHCVFFLLRLG
jgi:hypothetical protein